MERPGNLYQKLIFAAQSFLEETGRMPADAGELARHIDMDEGEILEVFPSVQDLHEGLVYHAVTLLNDRQNRDLADANITDPIEQLNCFLQSYLDWADENPVFFEVMARGLSSPIKPDGTLQRYTLSMRDLCLRKLREAQQLGILSADLDIETAVMMMHYLVKGTNMVFATRSIDPWLKCDPRPFRELSGHIFSEFMRYMTQANAPASTENA
ncbi:hypothetical protein F8A10_04790 [Paracoccus kondratievae]|uniref:TetR/AcrR family transcriptional regulator n=1 Tax=Paracoccus kondratievae TaxID=135740 RepID=A0AAD3P0L1_9RHOB|nr:MULTISPECIES: hypothetical protein [Paracoccus]QFQ86804.1 hypothetical protein F8A10_04790 [Paracoccus kondratievae]GLK65455.1 hypothetical protein GCM10017635_29300 [Paracoccus kondratievae]